MSAHIGIYIKGYDQATAVLNKISHDLDSLVGSIKQTGETAAAASSKVSGFATSLDVAAGVLARDVVRNLGRTVSEAMELGAQLDTLRRSFQRLTSSLGAADLSIERLRRATRGMVADVELLQSANQAMSLGVPVDQLDRMYDAAIRVGKAMGLTATQAINDFGFAIGRQSPKILDNFGITLRLTEAYDEYARVLGTSTEALTESEKETAFAVVAIRKLEERAAVLGDNIGEAEEAQERFNAELVNAKTALGDLLGPFSKYAGVIEGLVPALGVAVAPSLGRAISGLGGAFLALSGPVQLAVAAIAGLGLAYTSNFLGIRDAMAKVTTSLEEETVAQQKALRDGLQAQLAAIDGMVNEAETTYLSAYTQQLADEQAFYDAKLNAARQYVEDVRVARDADLDALELQYLKEKQAIEASARPYSDKQYYLERLEKQYANERARLSEDYRVKELESEQHLNEVVPKIEEERTNAILTLEEQKQADLADITASAQQQRLEAEEEFNDEMVALRAQLYDDLKALASEQPDYIKYYESYVPQVLPGGRGVKVPEAEILKVPGAQAGLEGLVTKPTLILAGEKAPEYLSITPRRPSMVPTTPSHVTQRVQVVVNAPLVYVQGNADWGVAEQAAVLIQQGLQNVVIEASTPEAPETHKRIRTGTTMISPTTLKPSSTSGQSTIFEGGGSGGSLGGSAPAAGGKPWTYF